MIFNMRHNVVTSPTVCARNMYRNNATIQNTPHGFLAEPSRHWCGGSNRKWQKKIHKNNEKLVIVSSKWIRFWSRSRKIFNGRTVWIITATTN